MQCGSNRRTEVLLDSLSISAFAVRLESEGPVAKQLNGKPIEEIQHAQAQNHGTYSLDGVIQIAGRPNDNDFPYGDWTAPYRTAAGLEIVLAMYGEAFELLLGRRTYDLWSGSGRGRRRVRWQIA